MTKYTMFNLYGNPDEENVAFLCESKDYALRNLPSGWHIIRGDYFKGKSDMWRENQVDAVRFIRRVINGEFRNAQPWYLDGIEWKQPVRNWEEELGEEDDYEASVKKMTFSDMVKKQRMKKDFTPKELSLEYGGIENAIYPLTTLVDYLEETIDNIQRNWETIGIKSNLNMSAEEFISTLYKKRDELINYLDNAFTFIA